MTPSIGNSWARQLDRLQLPSPAPNPAHFLATESGTSPPVPMYGYTRSTAYNLSRGATKASWRSSLRRPLMATSIADQAED